MQTIAIILLHYNNSAHTVECLQSLKTLDTENLTLKTYVVAYGDQSTPIDKPLTRFKGVTWIERKNNLGFAAANNIGISQALEDGADYVMLLNNDTLIATDLIVKLVNYIKQHPMVGCVSPKIYFAKGYEYHKKQYSSSQRGKVIWYAGGHIDWENMYASHRGVNEVDRGQYDTAIETEFASGCCMVIKKEVFESVGMLNESLFMYWEDVEFSLRVQHAGWSVQYAPLTQVWHKNAGGSEVGSALQNYFLTRNRLWMGRQYAAWRTKFAMLRQTLLQLLSKDTDLWTKRGIKDFYLKKMGRGSWE